MSNPRVQLLRLPTEILPQSEESEEIINAVKIRFDTNVNLYRRDPSGLKTLTASYQYSSPRLIEFSFPSSANFSEFYEFLRHHHSVSDGISMSLAARLARMAMNMRLGVDSFVIHLLVKLTYEYDRIDASEDDDVVGRLVMEGKIDDEISKSLGLESETCSICFENLLGTNLDKAPTRMSCSHVFHDQCISQWLRRKNSCPLCRGVLYGSR